MDPKSEGEIWLSLRFLGLAGIADEIFMTLNLFRNAKPGVQSQPIYIYRKSVQGPIFMNLSYVTGLPSAGSNWNHWFKGRLWIKFKQAVSSLNSLN